VVGVVTSLRYCTCKDDAGAKQQTVPERNSILNEAINTREEYDDKDTDTHRPQ
jgi:hypothetical protein